MIETTTTTTGIDKVLSGLARVQSGAAEAQRSVIQPLGTAYLAALQAETPKGRGEAQGRNRLSANYQVQERYGSDGAEYRITNTAPYLGWVLKGRGAVEAKHTRTTKGGRTVPGMLRFVIDGRVFFRRRVGPAAANNFPARVRARMQGRIEQAQHQVAGVIVRVYEGGSS